MRILFDTTIFTNSLKTPLGRRRASLGRSGPEQEAMERFWKKVKHERTLYFTRLLLFPGGGGYSLIWAI